MPSQSARGHSARATQNATSHPRSFIIGILDLFFRREQSLQQICRYDLPQTSSVRILRSDPRSRNTRDWGHFVFSPISSWLQLMNIAEGAERQSLTELRNVTGRNWKRCMSRIFREILNRDNQAAIKSESLVIVDKLLRVKKRFKKRLELLNTVRVESLNFDAADASSDIANEILSDATGGEIVDAVYPDDFNQTSLLMNDVISFSNAWLKPFMPVHTKKDSFITVKVSLVK